MKHVNSRPAGAHARITDSENYVRNSGEINCTGAHWTRLFCDIEHRIIKPPTISILCRRSDGYHLSVGCGILQGFNHVVSLAYDTTICHNNRSDGNFLSLKCFLRLTIRLFHPGFVRCDLHGKFRSFRHSKRVRPRGLEPLTSWSVAKRSIQLSYGRRLKEIDG